jgi:hypothetical protein
LSQVLMFLTFSFSSHRVLACFGWILAGERFYTLAITQWKTIGI